MDVLRASHDIRRHKAASRVRQQRVESSHPRSLAVRGERGNHTIYFCELLRVTVRVNLGAKPLYVRPRDPAPSTSIPKTFPSDQCLDPNLVALRGLALPESGAGDGNRTHGSSLGSLGITIIRRPPAVHCSLMPLRAAISSHAPAIYYFGSKVEIPPGAEIIDVSKEWGAPELIDNAAELIARRPEDPQRNRSSICRSSATACRLVSFASPMMATSSACCSGVIPLARAAAPCDAMQYLQPFVTLTAT
jgi:hypothetical protein